MTQKTNTKISADIAIVGAGLVGLSAAIAMSQAGKKVILVDAKNIDIKLKKTWDSRVYALTPAVENWLKTLGVWAHVDESRVNPINQMQLWKSNIDAPITLKDSDANCAKLGLIIENQNLMHALQQTLKALDVTNITDKQVINFESDDKVVSIVLDDNTRIDVTLLLAADGVNSWVREQAAIVANQKEFDQIAIVANFIAEKPHQNIARQWFAPHDILALLPLRDAKTSACKMVSMVWSVSTQRATELLLLDKYELAQSVLIYSKQTLGALQQVGVTQQFNLNQTTATTIIGKRLALLGDCAHQIHPMAGQGVNLGFRDVMTLQHLITRAHALIDIGEYSFLRQYARARKADVATMNSLTSGLDALFASENKLLNTAIDFGFKQISRQANIKKLLIQHAVA